MARDLFVYWAPEHKPSIEGVGHELREYLGRIATSIWLHSNNPRWMVELPGMPEVRVGMTAEASQLSRWIEVYVAEDNIDVITREQDDITNAIAVGFVERCARKWKGRIER